MKRPMLLLTGLLLLSLGCGGDDDPTAPAIDLVGTWKSENIILPPAVWPAPLRITLTSISESDASGHWSWGLDYAGSITGGGISGGAVTLKMPNNAYSFTVMAFSGQVQNGQIEGTFQGIAVTLLKQ